MDVDIQAIITQATANEDAEQAAIGALNSLFGKLITALAGSGPISAADRTAMQQTVAAMQASASAVAAAIVANTPAA